ncbi:anti-sigma factor family protein [Marinobacter litoralis]|uniref:anti-sigma factor family protein n=1 Tax=Marinobacter litoralis TaxID=187981 RepID=UPI0018EDFDD3|nr:anti-sigma factor [Marinobacter litoralis]MBJ6138975.1 anti-sigma factor [Marinobacter litoralis]
MNCETFITNIDIEANCNLTAEMKQHAEACPECARALRAAQELQSGMQSMAIPEPSRDFEARVLAAATGGDSKTGNRNWHIPAWSGAIAAALVVGVFIGGELSAPAPESAPVIAQESVSSSEVAATSPKQQTVKLAFNSHDAVENVTLTLELPPNMELAPFPGRHRVSWKVDLKPGDNLLALPLNVLFPGAGTLVAHLDDGNKRKTFRADIGKTKEPST